MSQFEKLMEKLSSLDTSLRFEELVKVLEAYGYEGRQPSGGSSHWTFRKPGANPITIPRKRRMDIAYIRLVRDAVQEREE